MTSWERLRSRLNKLAETRGFKAQLARKMGIPPSLLQRYLEGERTPGIDQLDKFAAALGVQSWELLKPESGNDPQSPEAEILEIIRVVLGSTSAQRASIQKILGFERRS